MIFSYPDFNSIMNPDNYNYYNEPKSQQPQNLQQNQYNNFYNPGQHQQTQYPPQFGGQFAAYDPLFDAAKQIGGQFAEQQRQKVV